MLIGLGVLHSFETVKVGGVRHGSLFSDVVGGSVVNSVMVSAIVAAAAIAIASFVVAIARVTLGVARMVAIFFVRAGVVAIAGGMLILITTFFLVKDSLIKVFFDVL